jgi:hypothetical protein
MNDIDSEYETIVQCAQRPPSNCSISNQLRLNAQKECGKEIIDLTLDFMVSYIRLFIHFYFSYFTLY